MLKKWLSGLRSKKFLPSDALLAEFCEAFPNLRDTTKPQGILPTYEEIEGLDIGRIIEDERQRLITEEKRLTIEGRIPPPESPEIIRLNNLDKLYKSYMEEFTAFRNGSADVRTL